MTKGKQRFELSKEEIVKILEKAKAKLEEAMELKSVQGSENLSYTVRNHHNNITVGLKAIEGLYSFKTTFLIVETLEQVVKKEKEREEKDEKGELPILHPVLLQAIYNLTISVIKQEQLS